MKMMVLPSERSPCLAQIGLGRRWWQDIDGTPVLLGDGRNCFWHLIGRKHLEAAELVKRRGRSTVLMAAYYQQTTQRRVQRLHQEPARGLKLQRKKTCNSDTTSQPFRIYIYIYIYIWTCEFTVHNINVTLYWIYITGLSESLLANKNSACLFYSSVFFIWVSTFGPQNHDEGCKPSKYGL